MEFLPSVEKYFGEVDKVDFEEDNIPQYVYEFENNFEYLTQNFNLVNGQQTIEFDVPAEKVGEIFKIKAEAKMTQIKIMLMLFLAIISGTL